MELLNIMERYKDTQTGPWGPTELCVKPLTLSSPFSYT